MKIGFIGLGKMGSRMVRKLLAEGHEVVVWNRSRAPIEELEKNVILVSRENETNPGSDSGSSTRMTVASTIKDLVEKLESPKIVWMMLPAGEATETILKEIKQYTETGDVIIDGGNSFYKDTEKRSKELKEKGIKFLGIGVSGGLPAFENGYPLMVGGDKEAYEEIKPLLDSLSRPHGGYRYFGEGGAGHFVKMVHNGIEYGQMQAIAEGFGVLEKSDYHFNLEEVAKLWQKGTIISGFLIDRAKDALGKDAHLAEDVGVVGASGEAEWTIEVAKEEQLEIPVIENSLAFRKQTQANTKLQSSFVAKMLNALRKEFGGHEIKK